MLAIIATLIGEDTTTLRVIVGAEIVVGASGCLIVTEVTEHDVIFKVRNLKLEMSHTVGGITHKQ